MKAIGAALALTLVGLVTTSASASYLLPPSASYEERLRYEYDHVQQNNYHTNDRTMRNTGPAATSATRPHAHSTKPAREVGSDRRR